MIGASILKTVIVEEPTQQQLKEWLQWHSQQLPRYKKLMNYYKGEQNIDKRVIKVDRNANNRTMVNWCGFITNTLSGYFLSLPIDYKTKTEQDLTFVEDINRLNTADDEDYELAKMSSIFGHAFEILYFDSNAQVRFNKCSPLNTFMLYDVNELVEIPKAAIRYQVNNDPISNKKVILVQYYTENYVTTYKLDETYNIIEQQERELHYYKSLPVIEYLNNEERIGDFEEIISLQDAYNIVTADRTNNIENVVNSLLVIINYAPPSTDEEFSKLVQRLKDNGMLFIDKEGDIKYISNQLDGTTVENLRKDLKNDILEISNCPDMSDEKFSGNTSGIAMKYKLWSTEQKTGAKEKKFRRAIYKRLELISETPKTKPFDWQVMDLVFTRNIPVNHVEKLESAAKIYGTISEQSYLDYIGSSVGIEDTTVELEKIKEERESKVEEYFTKEEVKEEIKVE